MPANTRQGRPGSPRSLSTARAPRSPHPCRRSSAPPGPGRTPASPVSPGGPFLMGVAWKRTSTSTGSARESATKATLPTGRRCRSPPGWTPPPRCQRPPRRRWSLVGEGRPTSTQDTRPHIAFQTGLASRAWLTIGARRDDAQSGRQRQMRCGLDRGIRSMRQRASRSTLVNVQ